MSAGPYELQIEQGVDRVIEITLKDKATELPIDITGWVFVMQIREKYSSTSVLYAPAVTIADAPGGKIQISLTATATSALPVKPLVYDLEATKPDTKKIRILKGPAIVDPEVTR
jgi:hypothetical protein